MKCAAIREDFLSAITEPAKCMEIEQSEEHIHHILSVSAENEKKLQSQNALLWRSVAGFLFAAIAH